MDPSVPPAPYGNAMSLYCMHLCFTFVSRMWDMGIVLLLAELSNNSLMVISLVGFCSSGSVFAFSSKFGAIMDKCDRLYYISFALAIKLVAITLAYGICLFLLYNRGVIDTSGDIPAVLFILPFVGSVITLTFKMVSMSIEKDWVIVLSNGNSEWLTATNSMLSQIDLGCKTVAPLITTFLFAVMKTASGDTNWVDVIVSLIIINAAATITFFSFVRNLYYSWGPLQHRVIAAPVQPPVENPEEPSNSDYLLDDRAINDRVGSTGNNFAKYKTPLERFYTFLGIYDFMQSKCAGAMFAFSCLYCTVLSFGSLMTVYLKWSGMSLMWIGYTRGFSAISGWFGAYIFPTLKQNYGLWWTAESALGFQFVCVAVAAVVTCLYAFESSHSITGIFNTSLVPFIVAFAVTVSRVGLWTFDLCIRQMAQEGIASQERGVVNGQWQGITAFFDMSPYIFGMYFSDPNDFYLLTLLSAVMVLLALVVFTRSREPSLEVPSSSRELQHLLHIQNNNQYGAAESSNQDEHTMTSLEFELTPPRQETKSMYSRKDTSNQYNGSVLGVQDNYPRSVRQVNKDGQDKP